MNRNDRYSSVFWAAAGLYIVFEGYRLQLGTIQEPKPGFLIFWAGLALFGLSVGLFLQSLRAREGAGKVLWRGARWSKVTSLMIAILIYALVFKWAGFMLCTFVLLLFMLKELGSQKWPAALALSLLAVVLSYVIFGLLLESQFPGGILQRWFGVLL